MSPAPGAATSPAAASVPPDKLPGLAPAWSRLVTAGGHGFHLLDNGIKDASVTLVCVHGNPTWSYSWRSVISAAPPGVRVIAVDQLEMGFSERTGTTRRLGQRVADLGTVIDALDITGPIITVGHDWGGAISLGWAVENVHRLAGVVLVNTAVHQPEGARAPLLIRMVRPFISWICVRLPLFLWGTTVLARPPLRKALRNAYFAPYRTAQRRAAIGDFVADIPLEAEHPSYDDLTAIARGLERLAEVPVLLLWGPEDPVFSDLYLRDLKARLPHADVHRFIGAGHLVVEDADIAGTIHRWVEVDPSPPTPAPGGRSPLWAALDARAADDAVAITEASYGGNRSMSFAELATAVRHVAAGMAAHGIAKGDRVALLVPPGIDLTIALYACWRRGAVVVLADAGLGPRGLTRAMASASPQYVIGIPRALAAARALRWPGERISVTTLSTLHNRTLGVATSLPALRAIGQGSPLPDPPVDDAAAAVVFTSGSTGPAKGVAYRHHQLQAQRDALMAAYGITGADRLVAAFGPFALYGPAMGITSMVPDMDVTSPGTLSATALVDAVSAIDATLVFASPAALTSIAATADALSSAAYQALKGVRMLLSAGAPVHPDVLRNARTLMPGAEAHTPYGMTEVLPVADITLEGIEAAGNGNGVCVGFPVAGVTVRISPLDRGGEASDELTDNPGVTGEILIRAPHMKETYDSLWATQQAAATPPGWHRSGDVGHFDDQGRLWVEGRMADIVTTAEGPVTPVGIEHAIESLPGIAQAAVVGVGPPGTQQSVAILRPTDPPRRPRLASVDRTDAVRAVAGVPVAAVLEVPRVPVDRRHNAKIHRGQLADWAEGALAGGRMSSP
ncbi:alpha/beta fold hydrolase [Pseudohaliea rubra]|uniref:Haloalkane dehalogenase-like protein / AMP-dependent synthetase/ligase in alkane synthesis cluster n=1 Tax=Pseudohaliea rubra DSM 19751 TaxID=1265313 RepID=A0A095X2C4_9GAMM|nr:alpha/beta fold hydrolase [Pseudohaliea rubra]KGE05019.1 Haloalkane dehalogenase-like protein / AMP-dependent synthetase/ligase in alkane synthesis cluster [Pseudohaliea rubra DSM 19751]